VNNYDARFVNISMIDCLTKTYEHWCFAFTNTNLLSDRQYTTHTFAIYHTLYSVDRRVSGCLDQAGSL